MRYVEYGLSVTNPPFFFFSSIHGGGEEEEEEEEEVEQEEEENGPQSLQAPKLLWGEEVQRCLSLDHANEQRAHPFAA